MQVLGVAGVLAALALSVSTPVEAADAWEVDKARSSLRFSGSSALGPFAGRFERWSAAIRFDPGRLAQSDVRVVIETGSARVGSPEYDEFLPQPDWFDTGRWPRATFVSRDIVSKGGDRYEAAGDLTIKGVRRRVVLPFTLAITGREAKMRGSLALNRTDFNVGTGQWSGEDTADHKVTVTVDLSARRAP